MYILSPLKTHSGRAKMRRKKNVKLLLVEIFECFFVREMSGIRLK